MSDSTARTDRREQEQTTAEKFEAMGGVSANGSPEPFKEPPIDMRLTYRIWEIEEDNGPPLTPNEQAEWDAYCAARDKANKERDRLGLVDLGEVMENGVTEPAPLVENLLVRNEHHVMYGPKEASKTWIALEAAVQRIQANETVVWVDKEMGQKNMADRLTTLGLDPEQVREHFVYMEYPSMDCSTPSRMLWEALLDLKKPSAVFFDAQTELLADAGLNENYGTDIEKWSQAYLTPARRLGSTTVMLDHTGHSEDERPVASRQKGAAAKIEWSVKKVERFSRNKVGRVTLKLTKNTVSAPFPERRTLKIGGEDGTFVYEWVDAGSDPKAVKERETDERIKNEIETRLEAKSPLNQTQIVGLVKGQKSRIEKVLKSAADSSLSRITVDISGRSLVYALAEQAAGDPSDPRDS